MDDRGLTSCSPFVPLLEGHPRLGLTYGQQDFGHIQVPGTLQYVVTVPAGATRLDLSLHATGLSGGAVALIALVRKTSRSAWTRPRAGASPTRPTSRAPRSRARGR